MAVRQKMTARSRDDQVAVHLAVRDRNLILGANGRSFGPDSGQAQVTLFFKSMSEIVSLLNSTKGQR